MSVTVTLPTIGSFEAVDFTWTAERPSGGGGRSPGRASIDSLDITKYVDSLSPTLLQHVAAGDVINEMDLSTQDAGGDGVQMAFVNVQLLSVTTDWSTGGQPTEVLSFDFEQLTYGVGGTSVTWNIPQGSVG
ncbi:MAG: type VI secretion system tube protein Hcp [Actinomycetota bacterium]